MYIAEIKGKIPKKFEGWEDLLTSNVFSFFKYSNRNFFLKYFLNKIDIKITAKELDEVEFNFWPNFDDKTQPDLVIIASKYYLLFEAKYHSDLSPDQIKREIQGGLIESKVLNKKFIYIAINYDYYHIKEKYQTATTLIGKNNFKWINWQSITDIVYNLINKYGDKLPNHLFATDLYNLLTKKNLRGFRSFSYLSYQYSEIGKNIFFLSDISKYSGYFLGFSKVLSHIIFIPHIKEEIFFKRG